jgi:acyl-[acyl-carrier-protein]-phospholipid O-acyltransferase/long-chain-fatty-acid--[acyl-carrier-protein] ligase
MGLVCHANPLEAGTVGELTEEYCATVLFATPTFLHLYARRCAPAQLGSLRIIVAGAEKMPDSLSRTYEDDFGVRPLEGYGVTECAPVVAVNRLEFRSAGLFQPGSRRGTVGHPLPGVSIQIVNVETGEPVGVATEGMIHVKGPNLMKGYLGRDDLTAAVIRNGWYATGDLGMLDEDGFLKVTGRLSRFSKLGGEMVPHGRVEEALNDAIGAEEPVFAVTAVPDGKGSERLAVLHTTDENTVDRALAKMKELGLPNLFLPRRDHFLKVDALPFLGTGKLDLRALRRTAEALLCTSETEPTRATLLAEA